MKQLDLEQIITKSHSVSDITNIPEDTKHDLCIIGDKCLERKGVYTVLVTLLYYKYLHPQQDVRIHQAQLPNGFSGRSFDTAHVTPVLKKVGLPAMAESGWLTRSLEQPYPYDFNYNGKIPATLKLPFLRSLDFVEKHKDCALNMLRLVLERAIAVSQQNKIVITPLINPERLTIDKIINAIHEHFNKHYKTHNGAKLPVLAFFAIYECLIKELQRYKACQLGPLSSLTACDKTNKASGDIEIFQSGNLFEAIEIKLNKKVDGQILRVVEDKIYKWNPKRYYILSVSGINEEDKEEILEVVQRVQQNHGCQIIINGLLPTIKYYLRLISDLRAFVEIYSSIVQDDTELQTAHKKAWNEIKAKYDI